MLPPENDSIPIEARADAIRSNGWKQGAILPHELLIKAADKWGIDTDEARCGVVISQDCDLVHSSFETEPYAEVLVAQTAPGTDGNRRWAKNPRIIQLALGNSLLDLCIHDRHRLQREMLCSYRPQEDLELDAESIRQLRSWLARRYKRAAFADELNNRIKTVESKISKKLKSAADLTGIYVLVTDDELEAGQDYEIDLRATMLPDDYDNWTRLEKCQTLLDETVYILNSVDGINVVNHATLSEDDVTLNDLRYLKRWDWDSLTLRRGTIDPADEDGSTAESVGGFRLNS